MLFRLSLRLSLLVAAVFILVRCSSTEPVQQPDLPEPVAEVGPTGPVYEMYYFLDGGLYRHEVGAERGDPLMLGVQPTESAALSPDGTRLAFVFAADSARLALFDTRSGTLEPVFAAPKGAVYTMDWANDSKALAFGYYMPQGNGGMGAGDILIAGIDGTLRRVGCSASKLVAAWPEPERLVVGNASNYYVVDADGCRTRNTQDRRKMSHVTFSPDGSTMAYIFRDLEYNSRQRAYVADSSFMLADFDGDNARTVYGDEYRVRNFNWNPEGTELLFDARSQDDTSVRNALIYKMREGRVGYVVPPDAAQGSTMHPMWSPSGTNIAYDWNIGSERLKAVRAFMNTLTLGPAVGPTWGWVGDQIVVIPAEDDTFKGYELERGTEIFATPAGASLLYVIVRNAS